MRAQIATLSLVALLLASSASCQSMRRHFQHQQHQLQGRAFQAQGEDQQAVVALGQAASGAKRFVHPETGNIHYEHEVHHVYEDTNTYFKASYTAEHEAHWNLIQLHEHIAEFEALAKAGGRLTKVQCGVSHSEEETNSRGEPRIRLDHLTIIHPSEQLLKQIHQQREHDYSHTAIMSHPTHLCEASGKGIFRKLIAVEETVDTKTGAVEQVVLFLDHITYEDVFKNLDFRLETNDVYVQEQIRNDDDTNLSADREKELQERVARAKEGNQHQMETQSFWHKLKHACHHFVHHVRHAVKHAVHHLGHEIKKAAKKVGKVISDVVTASFSTKKTFRLPGLNWNKDVTKTYESHDAVTAEAKIAASFDLHPEVVFELKVKHFKLYNFEVYVKGRAKAGLTGDYTVEGEKEKEYRKKLTEIKFEQIDFSIGPVPVWLQPYIPIYAGYVLTVDGSVEFKAVASAESDIVYGFAYAPHTGHRTISHHDFKFEHDFGPLDYQVEIGLKVYVEPQFHIDVDSVGDIGISAEIAAEAIIQSNNECIFDLNIFAQPTISLTAGINIRIEQKTLWEHEFGPWALWSHKYPIYSYCKPNPYKAELAARHGGVERSGRRQSNNLALPAPPSTSLPSHKMVEQQATVAEVGPDGPVINNNAEVGDEASAVTTTFVAIGQNQIGKMWHGSSTALNNGNEIEMVYGVQHTIGEVENTSAIYVTMSQRMASPDLNVTENDNVTFSGELTALAVLTYFCNDIPAIGKTLTYTLITDETAYDNVTYVNNASNADVFAITPSPTMTMTFNKEDVRLAELFSTMTYGTVTMISPASTNSTTPFRIFEQGGATIEVVEDDKIDVGLVVWGALATFFILVLVVVVVALILQKRTAEAAAAAAASNNKPSEPVAED